VTPLALLHWQESLQGFPGQACSNTTGIIDSCRYRNEISARTPVYLPGIHSGIQVCCHFCRAASARLARPAGPSRALSHEAGAASTAAWPHWPPGSLPVSAWPQRPTLQGGRWRSASLRRLRCTGSAPSGKLTKGDILKYHCMS